MYLCLKASKHKRRIQLVQLLAACLVACFCTSALAWDATGHRLIASIAYQQLTSVTKAKVDRLTAVLLKQDEPKNQQQQKPLARFLQASVWPDQLRAEGVTAYNSWHYINFPLMLAKVRARPINRENVVWAIGQSEQVLASSRASSIQQAEFLAFLIHFVGDVHQPLHCVTRYSRQYPRGDQGGNLFNIKTQWTDNLHQYWDQGVGLFDQPSERYPLSDQAVSVLAAKISKQYPVKGFADELKQTDPKQWAEESYQIAKHQAYRLKANSRPSANYVKLGQQTVARQIALSGYRLAALLNTLYG